ncbi:MAG TPA: SufD family Fe-S cluster assembly protein [Candidatus Dojkabacteria bacterium]
MNKLVNLETNEMIMTEEGEILGLFVLKNKESIKSKIYFTHKKPNLYTRITLKFILLDESEIDIEPTVRIEKGASLTNTYLRVDTLLLSKNARAHVVPSMEILEDEVKGGHGATIGMIDENQIWYLMSRGITKKEAEKILIEAFVNSLIQETDNPEIKEKFEKELEKLKLD